MLKNIFTLIRLDEPLAILVDPIEKSVFHENRVFHEIRELCFWNHCSRLLLDVKFYS